MASTPATPPPPRVAQEEGRVAPVLEARRYSIGEALVAAGAPLTEAQAMGTNANATMRRATRKTTHPPDGIAAAAWLEERGWTPLGREWIPPSGGSQ